ncbi:protein ApaG [Nephila pilipes]|uniref:Protein ApaG n=1 Tax=Nephila pilipes TaxID=299642 RepID=A0A8X6PUN6_NEPPI|nr:protein ApaG [Nephila pilipes]
MIEYTLTTNFVEVKVLPIYIEEQSIPYENCYVWMYNVKIKNKSQSTIQLLSRHWQIIDHKGKIDEIAGVGVIGEQPVIKSGEVFKYISGTYLNVPSGIMQAYGQEEQHKRTEKRNSLSSGIRSMWQSNLEVQKRLKALEAKSSSRWHYLRRADNSSRRLRKKKRSMEN